MLRAADYFLRLATSAESCRHRSASHAMNSTRRVGRGVSAEENVGYILGGQDEVFTSYQGLVNASFQRFIIGR